MMYSHNAEQVTTLKSKIKVVLDKDTAKVVQRADINIIDAQAISFFIEKAKKLYLQFNEVDLTVVPQKAIVDITNCTSILITKINAIEEFTVMSSLAYNISLEKLIDELKTAYENCYNLMVTQIAYHSAIKSKETEVLELISTAKDVLEQNLAEIRQKKAEIETETNKVFEEIKKNSGAIGIKDNAIYFKNEADENKLMADKWLGYTRWMAASTGVVALISLVIYLLVGNNLSFEKNLQIAITKIVFLSIMYYATVWCGKNYRAYMHNYVVNKHRQNGLSTFEAFVKGTSDEATKNAVLLRSTEAIFGQAHSGFSSNETEGSGSPQILEIVRSITDTKRN